MYFTSVNHQKKKKKRNHLQIINIYVIFRKRLKIICFSPERFKNRSGAAEYDTYFLDSEQNVLLLYCCMCVCFFFYYYSILSGENCFTRRVLLRCSNVTTFPKEFRVQLMRQSGNFFDFRCSFLIKWEKQEIDRRNNGQMYSSGFIIIFELGSKLCGDVTFSQYLKKNVQKVLTVHELFTGIFTLDRNACKCDTRFIVSCIQYLDEKKKKII